MHETSVFTERRVLRFLHERVEPAVYRDARPARVSAWTTPGEPVPFGEAMAGDFQPMSVGDPWGSAWATTWLRIECPPASWPGGPGTSAGTRPELIVDLGFTGDEPGFQAEGLAYDDNGHILKGISPRNRHVPLVDGDHRLSVVYVEAAANPVVFRGRDFRPTPLGDRATAGPEPLYRLRRADVALLDVGVWELWQDLVTVTDLVHELPPDSTRRARILQACERMLDVVDQHDVAGTAAAAREELRPALEPPAHASAQTIAAVGHAHIDSAWLWPVRETIRKCARSFANAMTLMDDNPDFVFACSSAQQYAWIKEHYPELYERIRERVADGQFRPVGGMWVEADTNLPGGEAMARQFVEGKRFFLEEFGIETEEVWLPDSFGYSGALPQLVALSGSRWFLTQKLSWNESNRMPHHTFWWEGIDGTRVFTHFPPVDTYTSDLRARDLLHAERTFRDKAAASISLVPFGWGDGGGGPTREMIAQARRFADLEGAPRVQLMGPDEFFRTAEEDYPAAPVWSGELYLEFHRGTYTSQARTKRGNRRCEHLLREAELWATTAMVRTGAVYPAEELRAAWQAVLLNQFHDILPGSSIRWVYQDAERQYTEVAESVERIIAEALASLAGSGDRRISVNAAPHPRSGVPALGAASEIADEPGSVTVDHIADSVTIGNGVLRVVVDGDGLISSLYDLAADRETIPPGQRAGLLRLHPDHPRQWDAWDVDAAHLRVAEDLVRVDRLTVAVDDRMATVTIRRSTDASAIEQRIVIRAGDPCVELVTTVDWHDRERLLKLVLPFDVQADRSAAETQFGHVFRPTHVNTSWDAARFEACAHRWVQIGEPEYGIAVSNDATYGHDIHRAWTADGAPYTSVQLSLLRAPTFPDPEADQGDHEFRVVVHPGAGIAEAVVDGYRTNLPVRELRGARAVAPLVEVSGNAVVVESVTAAFDGSGDVIVRLYESLGGRARARVTPGFQTDHVAVTDLLEREIAATGPTSSGLVGTGPGGVAEIELHPFQVLTLRFART